MRVAPLGGGRGTPHRAPVVHKATLTAARVGGPQRPPAIPRRYRAKTAPSPSPSLRLPTVGKLPKATGKAVPVPQPGMAAPQSGGSPRVSIPHPTTPVPPYVNPLRGIKGLTPERIDQGVD